MKHLRKTIAAFTAVTAFAALTGCAGGAGEESGDKIVLNYWNQTESGPPLELSNSQVAAFNEAHPDIEVRERNISNASFFTVMRNAFTSGNPPEIFAHEGNNNLFQFVREDQVAPITEWWNEPGNGDRFTPGAPVNSVTYDGEIYGTPGGLVTTNQLYYNKTILDEAGIDPSSLETWDDFLAAFEQLKDDGITPIAYGNSEGWPGSQFFYDLLSKTAGATKINQLIARNCGYKWTDPDVVQAAQLYTDLSDNGYFSDGKSSDDYTTATATFFSGRAAFFQGGSWVVPEIAASPDRDNYGLITFPMVEGGNGSVTEGLISSGGFALSTSVDTDEELEAALTFLDWMNQPEQLRESVAIGNISAVGEANDPAVTDPLIQQIIDEQIAPSTGSFPFLEHVLPKAVGEDAIWQGSIAVLTGQATPESWMENVERVAAAEEPSVILPEECS